MPENLWKLRFTYLFEGTVLEYYYRYLSLAIDLNHERRHSLHLTNIMETSGSCICNEFPKHNKQRTCVTASKQNICESTLHRKCHSHKTSRRSRQMCNRSQVKVYKIWTSKGTCKIRPDWFETVTHKANIVYIGYG